MLISDFTSTASSGYRNFILDNFDRIELPIFHKIEGVFIPSDCFKIDGIRFSVSYNLALELAAKLTMRLPTLDEALVFAKHADIRNEPHIQPISCSGEASVRYSSGVDTEVSNMQGNIILNPCKLWLANAPVGKAINFGYFLDTEKPTWRKIKLHPSGLNGVKVIQPFSTVHNRWHSDGSQCCWLVY